MYGPRPKRKRSIFKTFRLKTKGKDPGLVKVKRPIKEKDPEGPYVHPRDLDSEKIKITSPKVYSKKELKAKMRLGY